MKKIIILFFISARFLFCRESVFDKVEWIKSEEKNGVHLFIQKNKGEKINYYKAEKELELKENEAVNFFNNLMDFKSYPEIFPRTLLFKKIKEISENTILVYSQVNFKPMKNRDYYIIVERSFNEGEKRKEWMLEWYPVDLTTDNLLINEDFMRVKNIYGRWIISADKNKVKISVEYYNDFSLNISNRITSYFEKNSTIDALLGLESYTLRRK